MLEALISSKTRIKILLKFFLNSNTTAYLRSLSTEFNDSSNAIRIELNRFEKAGLLLSNLSGNKKIFQANTAHPLYKEIHNIVLKQLGIDNVIETVVNNLGDVDSVYLIGDFALGKNSNIIDLLIVGNIDKNYLIQLIEKTEKLITRKIRYINYTKQELEDSGIMKEDNIPLLLWQKDNN